MPRLIDADALERIVEEKFHEHYGNTVYQFIHDFFRFVIRQIRKAPTIEPESLRPHGRWRRSGILIECCYCGEIYSLSGGNDDKDWNACPSCTALMDFEQATCGDCLYVELCETDHSLTEFSRDNPAYCKKFHPQLRRDDG